MRGSAGFRWTVGAARHTPIRPRARTRTNKPARSISRGCRASGSAPRAARNWGRRARLRAHHPARRRRRDTRSGGVEARAPAGCRAQTHTRRRTRQHKRKDICADARMVMPAIVPRPLTSCQDHFARRLTSSYPERHMRLIASRLRSITGICPRDSASTARSVSVRRSRQNVLRNVHVAGRYVLGQPVVLDVVDPDFRVRVAARPPTAFH
jgi:hypothetical protein